MKNIKIGQKIYNRGDMANIEHFGTITKIKNDNWGEHVLITPNEDSERKPYWVDSCLIDEIDKGNGLTRIVTIEAYNSFRKKQLEHLLNR